MIKRCSLICVFLSLLFIGIASEASAQVSLEYFSPPPLSLGSEASWEIDITTGSEGVNDITVDETLPAPSGIVWATDSTGCTLGTVSGGVQMLACDLDLPANSFAAVVVTTIPTALMCETLNFTVSVTSPGQEPLSNSLSDVVDCPALSVTKSADAASVTQGSPIGFTIGVSNGSSTTATATNVMLTDRLPTPTGLNAAWTIASDSTGLCSISYDASGDEILSCPYRNLAGGASKSVHVTATYTGCGQFSNTAVVTAGNSSMVSSPQASTTVLCSSGLNVVTTPDSTPISADATAGFTTTVSVSASSTPTATDVKLSQPLPGDSTTNWQVDPTSQAAADCSVTGAAGSQVLSCALGSIAPGNSEAVHVTSPTTFGSCNSYSTTATATSDNYASATSTASLMVECPALTLSKTADAASVGAGGTIGFTLTMSNSNQSGTGAAYNATLTDFPPNVPGETWTISPPTSGCTITGVEAAQELSCSASTLAAGDSLIVHLQSNTDPSYCGSYTNTATGSADNSGSSPSASASTMVLCPSLQISKTADNATVSGGDQIGYTINVTNSGTGDATGVTISDMLPANSGLDWTVASPASGCSIAADALSCSLGTVAAGTSASVHVVSPTDQTTCGTVSNSATVSASNSATVPPSSTAAISVNCPTLGLTNMASAGSVNAGGSIGYTLVATNMGAGTAEGVTLSETLPNAAGLDWTISPAYTMPGTCEITGSVGAQILSCSFGNLATGASATVGIISPTGDTSCGAESPTAYLSATNASTLMQGATATVLCPQLQVTKTPSSSTASADDTIGFGITVNNNGAGIADGVILTDSLPTESGLIWTITGPNLSGCTIAAGVLSCNIGSLNPGGTASVSISSPTTPATCGAVNNTATATATNGVTAQSSTAVTVGCPELMVTKTPASNPVNAGQNAAFNIVVNNLGTGVARGTTLTDTLPTGITWTDNNSACQISSGVMTCNFGNLAASQTQTVTVTGATPAKLCAPLTNTASVTATNETSADLANNSSIATININCQADLAILKLPLLPKVTQGSWQTYLIAVYNAGPHPAQGVVMSDPTPTGTVFASLLAGGSCTKPAAGAAGPVSCQIPTLAVGSTWLGLLTVKVTAPAKSTIINEATVTGTTVDPNPGNDTTTVSTPVL